MNSWLAQVFAAGAVAQGNIVRRKRASVIRYASLAELQREVRRRGFHMIYCGDQVIVICNTGAVRIIC